MSASILSVQMFGEYKITAFQFSQNQYDFGEMHQRLFLWVFSAGAWCLIVLDLGVY